MHGDIHVAVALDHLGATLGTVQVPATRAGFRRLLDWASALGVIDRVGVEGTGSYGAGLEVAGDAPPVAAPGRRLELAALHLQPARQVPPTVTSLGITSPPRACSASRRARWSSAFPRSASLRPLPALTARRNRTAARRACTTRYRLPRAPAATVAPGPRLLAEVPDHSPGLAALVDVPSHMALPSWEDAHRTRCDTETRVSNSLAPVVDETTAPAPLSTVERWVDLRVRRRCSGGPAGARTRNQRINERPIESPSGPAASRSVHRSIVVRCGGVPPRPAPFAASRWQLVIEFTGLSSC